MKCFMFFKGEWNQREIKREKGKRENIKKEKNNGRIHFSSPVTFFYISVK